MWVCFFMDFAEEEIVRLRLLREASWLRGLILSPPATYTYVKNKKPPEAIE
jgi:hypothetical protein